MKRTLIFIGIIILIMLIDSISSHIVFNKRIKDIPRLESKILELTNDNKKLIDEKEILISVNHQLNNEINYLRSVKTIKVPEYHVIEYGNRELLDEIDELKERLEEEGIDDY